MEKEDECRRGVREEIKSMYISLKGEKEKECVYRKTGRKDKQSVKEKRGKRE